MADNKTRIAVLLTIVFLGGIAIATTAQAQSAPAQLNAKPLRDGVYWVKGGSGANTGFIVGSKEVIVIDAKMTEESAKAMLREIKKLTPLPVKHVVITHSDGDHVNGLSGFPKGLTIIAHASTKKDMEAAFKDPKMSALVSYLPNETLDGSREITIDGIRMNLIYLGPAHTSGDLIVHLPDQRIAFVGDLVFVGRDPLVHRHKSGSSLGLVQYLNRMISLDADTFISGHSDPLTKEGIRGALNSIEETQAKIKALIEQGKSASEIKSAFGITEASGQAGRGRLSFVEIVYQDLLANE